MPTFDNIPDFPATPYFGTVVKIDTPETVLQEPPSGETRTADEIARLATTYTSSAGAPQPSTKNVRLVPGIGWQLRPYQADAGHAAERQAAQGGIMRPASEGGTLRASTYLGKFASWAQSNDVGVTYPSGSAQTGDDHYELQLPADDGFDVRTAGLAADQAAFPGPPQDSASPNSIRLVVDTVPDEPGKPLHVKITIPGGIVGANHALGDAMFSGPASQASWKGGNIQGLGQYCFRPFGDGTAVLMERCKRQVSAGVYAEPTWDTVQTGIRWCAPSGVAGSAHHIEIVCHEFASPRGNRTGYVCVFASDTASAASQGAGSPLQLWGSTNPTGFLKYYATCENPALWIPAQHQPVRFDHRSDARPAVQLSRSVYPSEGYLVDDPYETYVFPGYSGAEFRAYFLGDVPPGTSATIEVFKEGDDPIGGAPLAATGRTTASYGQVASYQVPPNAPNGIDVLRTFLVRVKLTSDGNATPTIEKIGFVKDGATQTYDVGETVVEHPIFEFQGSGQDEETGRQSWSCEFTDLHGKATALSFRSEMPFRATVRYPEGPIGVPVDGSSPRSIVLRGYVSTATSEKLYRDPRQGIHQNARRYRPEIVSMHKRLDEAIVLLGFDLVDDAQINAETGSKTPRLASDGLRDFVLWSGFAEEEIGWDYGDSRYPERLWPKEGNGSSPGTGNPGAEVGEMAMQYARDYLGRYLDYEPNSSRIAPADGEDPSGMWELVDAPLPPYRPLARFENAPVPGGQGMYLTHVPWPDWEYGGRQVPVRAILKGETKTPIAPEFNWLLVVGMGNVVGQATPVKLTSVVPNLASMNALATMDTTDPTNVSYVGRPKRALYVNSQLGTPEAVLFTGRRLLDYAGTGRILRPFTAPLVLVWDEAAPYLRRRRPLRPNDCVVVRGRMCVVKSCAPFANKDGFQMQRLECQELPASSYPPL